MDLDTALNNFLGERELLIRGIAREYRKGTPAQKIAERVQRAFGRDQVLEYLRAIKMQDAARKALAEAGLEWSADVSVFGIDAPREAWIHLAADPAETPDFQHLPGRIRDALAPYHLTLAPPADEEGDVDERLFNTERVRLVKVRPRS
ncbi:hypothetical protein ABZ023_26000 [Streptomyces sp. NPDC006367]|uniref:hypothetical protein n=1 Tax=unclassified Streptomyces TaxID=2593676 RepID=UPI00339DBB8C